MTLRPGARSRAQSHRHRLAHGPVVVSAFAVVLACRADPGYQGRPSASWVAQLAGGETLDARVDAAGALGRVLDLQPDDRDAVAALVAALADTNDVLRTSAASALTGAGRGGRRTRAALPGAVPRLVALLGDTAHADVRGEAARVLGALGGASVAGGGTPALGAALRDGSAAVRGTALNALGAIGPTARAAWPALDTALLSAAMNDSVSANRRDALAALGATGAPAPLLVPALTRAVADMDAEVRMAAVRALGLLGVTTDAGARAALTRALRDQDGTVRQEAQHALTALHRRGGDDPASPELSPLERCAGSHNQAPGC